jgi:hypothetical protein
VSGPSVLLTVGYAAADNGGEILIVVPGCGTRFVAFFISYKIHSI